MLAEVLAKYLDLFPDDRERLAVLAGQIEKKEDLQSRTNYTGHVTGSAIIFAPDLDKMLLIYHPTFEAWQQPGGHWEADETGPWQTAEREAVEETGVNIDRAVSFSDRRIPIQIDSHLVPSKPPKNEPPHYHHDFRYVLIASDNQLELRDQVIKKAEWITLPDITDKRLVQAARRANQLLNLKG